MPREFPTYSTLIKSQDQAICSLVCTSRKEKNRERTYL